MCEDHWSGEILFFTNGIDYDKNTKNYVDETKRYWWAPSNVAYGRVCPFS